ncbi:MAG: DUF169 domain-containing protein [Deltaproteobacteria bacterium]|nr:DUF169 domain-containing protein [Deltaproteobacteria bacterium]
MHSQIAETLKLNLCPVAILLTDAKPEKAIQFKEGRRGCVAATLLAAANGKTGVFNRKTTGCPGGGTGLGFGNSFKGFPIDQLLSTGGKAVMPSGNIFDMGEGERFFQSPQLASRWANELPYRDVPTEFVVCKPLEKVTQTEQISLVLMFVNPDQLSALVTLAGFRRGTSGATVSPFGAACQSILFAFAESESDQPRGVIGFFDISQRKKISKELLSFTMPYQLYLEMETSVDESFLNTPMWQQLCERW